MKSLQIIQTIAKVCKVICKVVFIVSVVGACLCAAGGIWLAIFGQDPIRIGDVNVSGLIASEAGVGTPVLLASVIVNGIFCIASAIVSKFGEKYLTNELADGTPFTLRGAKEMRRLGIIDIVATFVSGGLCAGGLAVASMFIPEINEDLFEGGMSMGLGVMLILLSVFCQYGAELNEKPAETAVQTAEEPAATEETTL